MERYQHAPYARDWYVFDGKHVLMVDEDYIAISSILPSFREAKGSDVRRGPHLTIASVGAHTLRQFALRGGKVALSLEGEEVGSHRENSGYDAAASGSISRRVTTAKLEVEIQGNAFVLRVSGAASAVEQEEPQVNVSGLRAVPLEFAYEFSILLEDVPELLNMNEEHRWRFGRKLKERGAA
jgi:hypothetical protein